MWKTQKPDEQEKILLEQFYRLMEALVFYNVPIIFLAFPHFAHDLKYFYGQLQPILKEEHDFERFRAVCEKIIDAKKISIGPER